MCLLLDDVYQSAVVLDTDIDAGKCTVSGLLPDTSYTFSVTALSTAGHSESVVISNVTTSSVTLTSSAGHKVAVIIVVSVLIVLALMGVFACIRCILYRLLLAFHSFHVRPLKLITITIAVK